MNCQNCGSPDRVNLRCSNHILVDNGSDSHDPRVVAIIRSLEAENATLRAEVERLTQERAGDQQRLFHTEAALERLTKLMDEVKREITKEPLIGRIVERLFGEPCDRAIRENAILREKLERQSYKVCEKTNDCLLREGHEGDCDV